MASKNILFTSLFDLTRLYRRLSVGLEQAGHTVFWIATNRTWITWLEEQGVPPERILRLIYTPADFVADVEKEQLRAEMIAAEKTGDITFNQALQMDRFVSQAPPPRINEYLYLYYRDIKRFLQSNRIDLVVCEPTNLNELVTWLICGQLDIRLIAAWDMRYPTGRVVFTEGYLQGRVVPVGDGAESDAGEKFIREFRASRQRPTYFDHQNRQAVTTPGKLLRSAGRRFRRGEVTGQPNLTHHRVSERAGLIFRRICNGFYLRHLARYDCLDLIEGRIAFFGLHVQPEASIDVRGSYFSDQLKLIADIRRALPFDTTLVIKEHPNFLGIRGRSFFRRLRRLPNVALVKHDVSTFDILNRAEVVFTVSGTVAYEAGLLGIPAVTFSPLYFDRLASVHYCPEITGLKALLREIRERGEVDTSGDGAVMTELIGNSFAGRWADPFNYPAVMNEDNLARLEAAFLKVIGDAGR